MAKQWDMEGKPKTGHKQGTYELLFKNPRDLQVNDEVECATFDAGSFKWILALTCLLDKCKRKAIKVFVIPQNDEGVTADVYLWVSTTRTQKEFPATEKTVCPYVPILKRCIPVIELTGSEEFDADDELTVKVDLKRIEEAPFREQRRNTNDMSTVKLEVIDDDSIVKYLRGGQIHGVAGQVRESNTELHVHSVVRCWATRVADCRYFLCDRRRDGSISVKECLNESNLLVTFEDVSEKDSKGQRWVTVFKDKMQKNQFNTVDDDSIFVFCKIFDSASKEVTYLGNLVVQKTMSCQNLLEIVADDMAQIPDGKRYRAFVEKGRHAEEITSHPGKLDECGIHSGSIVIVEKCVSEVADDSDETVLGVLLAARAGDPPQQGDDSGLNPEQPDETPSVVASVIRSAAETEPLERAATKGSVPTQNRSMQDRLSSLKTTNPAQPEATPDQVA